MPSYQSVRAHWGPLLHWHLKINGTRPELGPDRQGDVWEDDEFADACGAGNALEPRSGARKVQLWLAGVTTHSFSKIEKALFGDNERYAAWRRDLREAHSAARASKYARVPVEAVIGRHEQTFATTMATGSNFMVPGAFSDDAWLSLLPQFVETARIYEGDGKVFQFYELIGCIYWRFRHCSVQRVRWTASDEVIGVAAAKLQTLATLALESSGIAGLLRGDHSRFEAEATKRAAKADMKRAYGSDDELAYRMSMARLVHSFALFGARWPAFKRDLGLEGSGSNLVHIASTLFQVDPSLLIQQTIIDYQARMSAGDCAEAKSCLDTVNGKYGDLEKTSTLRYYPGYSLHADRLHEEFRPMIPLGNWAQNKAKYFCWLNIRGNEKRGTCMRAREALERSRQFYKWSGLQATHANAHLLTAEGMIEYAEGNTHCSLEKLAAAVSGYRVCGDEERWSTVNSLANEICTCQTISEPTMRRFVECSEVA